MDALLTERLDQLDKALNRLIDSISSYNPSVPAAAELLTADDQLTAGLRQLAVHQANHDQILSLRTDITTFTTATRESLSRLASVREEVLSIPLLVPQDRPEHDSVKYTDLLDYASKVSRYTVPPKRLDGSLLSLESQIPQESATLDLRVEDNVPHDQVASPSAVELGFGVKQLQEAEVQWLHPENLVSFLPWPTEEVIQRGALAAIDRGDTAELDPAQVQEQGADMEGTEQQHVGDTQAEETSKQGEAAVAQVSSFKREVIEQKSKVFGGLDLYDPDMEG